MLEELQAWFANCKTELANSGYQIDFVELPRGRDKPSASITIASARRIGQLTVWSTGEAELSMGMQTPERSPKSIERLLLRLACRMRPRHLLAG
jgi:hypothetical protein